SLLRDWVDYQCEHPVLSPNVLNAQGVDVILEPVSFAREKRLTLTNRYLKAHRYLLTDGYNTSPTLGYPCHQLTQLKTLPQRVAVIGRGATVVEWAYALSLRAVVTLILLEPLLLPAEDRDIRRLVEAQLRSLGIEIVFSQDGMRAGSIQFEKNIADVAPLLVNVPCPYDWDGLQLENIEIKSATPIAVNPYLQTCCPQVYVSGGSQGGENRPELTRQETLIALENALFGRRHVMRYDHAFYSIYCLSTIGHWGLTERQARQCYGLDIQIFQASCLPAFSTKVAQTNFCKLIITQGQRIVGVHLMGEGADVVVAALGKSPDLQSISSWAVTNFQPGTLQDAIYQAIAQWKQERWCEGQWRRDWAENWFNFRRSL
ncbi:MAG: FAD-dependent oxidoreductase, partial [Leptolyngbyaceae cyanobacterium MAG.088]|nr:FAD-dependent oxidoreductase [Leptolyngbyaceae cyanobacterium MAG.088]